MSGVVCSSREGSAKKQRKQHTEEDIVFCNSTSPGFTQVHTDGEMAPYSKLDRKKNPQNISKICSMLLLS